MEEFVGALLFGVFVVWLAVMAVWVALALLVRIVAWVIVYFAATAALGLVGGLLHGFTIPVQALMQGRAQVATPARMAAGELIKNPPPGENAAHGWDRAWPVYVPYQAGFDRQAVNALTKKRVRAAWAFFTSRGPQSGRPAAGWKKTLGQKMLDVPHWLAWSVVALPLIGCFIVGTVASVLTWQVIMWLGQSLVTLASAAVQAILRWYESWSRRRAHQSMLCSHCLRSSSSPAYRCSRCSVVHYVVQPGPQGLLHRVCECGAKLPNTVSGASRKLKVVCPYCGQDMADGAGIRHVVVLPVIGAVAAGKTRFLRMSVVQVGDGLTGRGSLMALSPEAKAFLNDSRELVRDGRHTVKTPHVMPRALQYQVVERGREEIELNIIDAAGEFFGDWETSNELPFLEAAPAYVLLIDPLGLADVHAEFAQTLPADRNDMDIAPPDQINAYHTVMDRLRAQGVDLSKRALLVVVSKADILRSLPCGQTLRGSASSDAVRQWLAGNGMDAALQSFRMDFGTVEYFACDSMHHLPHEDPVSPWRVVSRVAALNDAAAIRTEPTEPAGRPAPAGATA
ncbi:TRAFAC clade GTPase domain-containing protein [Actinomyces sp. oral taxon 414]|jgi:hypothetical protein|uniref:TRAFAC clade GTPase domain-containing protein n=1 Tax=Actinomyces sp. oral taxon 414 TaxID=712122 RepID=UPI000AB1224B|nr:hypothetical protein [Actinomyces sp. oral taxon 414]